MSDAHNAPLSEERVLDAAEYVLGTLEADASKRLEHELAGDAALRAEVDYWQGRLGALGLALTPVEPPAEVWRAIAQRAGLSLDETAAAGARKDKVTEMGRSSAAGRSRFWPGLAIAASVVALALAALLFNTGLHDQARPAAQPAYASVVYDKSTGTSWLVTAPEHPQQLVVTAMGRFPLPKGKVMRAWLKPANAAPIYIGTWPTTGKHRLTLPANAARDITQQSSQLMVTMEDASVAASSSPNGPLLFAAPVGRQHTG